MKILSLLLLLGLGVLSTATSSADEQVSLTTTPPHYDDWCSLHCDSLIACNALYDSNHVDLRLRVKFPIDDGPGRHLIHDKYFGSTISRQSFETQFILDIATAIESSPCRLYVINVYPEGNDNYWDSDSVFINFRIYPADSAAVADLTKQIQQPNSTLYDGDVTYATDALYGLVAPQWDHSIKLMYSIPIIGGNDVINAKYGRYLNQGSLQSCNVGSKLQINNEYCTFENHLVNDMETILELKQGQFLVLFIKEADRHSVIVSFRLVPEVSMNNNGQQDTGWVHSKVLDLVMQISDSESLLYSGNVTFKIDPTWGVSGMSKRSRQFSKYLSQPVPSTSKDVYERCKATRRCPRASSQYNQSSAESFYTFQEYLGGEDTQASLFLDFEDWRFVTRGWEQSCRGGSRDLCLPAPEVSYKVYDKPKGAHWSPFDFEALGPSVPTFGKKWNNGLVLNMKELELDITKQMKLIGQYEALVTWLDDEYRHGVTDDALLRTRKEIRENITNYTATISAEREVLDTLQQSQCSNNVQCSLLFNTSDASLSGAVNATGVITTTPDGTEVALWAFDSIDIDEHVNVTLTGQRAMALVSRSSVRINTTFNAFPGTLGGFPGGFSVQFLDICPGDVPISELTNNDITSNNINGPGSPSTRVYLMTIQTSAPVRNEIQSVTIDADRGQTLSGGFRLHFNGYTTPFLPHDITASNLKKKMEDSLNPVKHNQLSSFDRDDSVVAGIGTVDVTRDSFGTSGGSRWNITFTSAVGNIGKDSSLLTATNHLVSKGARVNIETIQNGNSIGGQFALKFLGNVTRWLQHDVAASELEDILSQDIPSLSTVNVLRSDPSENCNDGHCNNGAGKSGGYIWTLTLATQVGNISPSSPTSSHFDKQGDIDTMTALNYLTGCIDSQCPTIEIKMGHSNSHNAEMRSINGTKPFSLAYGGAGAGYGGRGGQGFGDSSPGQVHGDERLTNLYGGSGGGVGVKQPFQLGVFKQPRFRGGSGGGAVEIVATNDIIIGSNASILCNGESGADAYLSAGGGGSGGSILLAAGSTIQVDTGAKLSVTGGHGGHKRSNNMPHNSFGGHGGGGSGGRIALFGQSVVLGEASNVSLTGGNCSVAETTMQNCTGEEGSLFIDSALDTDLIVDRDIGAEGTRSSLHLRPREIRQPPNSHTLLQSTQSAPEFDLGQSTRPGRVSFYFRVENPSKRGWDATFELRESRWSYLATTSNTNYTAMVGIVIGKEIRHGTNYFAMPFNDEHVKHLSTIKPSVKSHKWFKVDIHFNWNDNTHDVYVDDVRVVFKSPFQGESIRSISLGNYYEGGEVWFDEIFVGEDTTMGFHCPVVQSDGTLYMDRPLQKGWKMEDIGEPSSLRPMQRHESHVSRRTIYQREDNKFVVPFEGTGENDFTSDVKFRSKDGDRIHEKGKVLAGALLRLPRDQATNSSSSQNENIISHGMPPNTYMWYGEHDHLADPRQVSGAVMACSTQDFVTWKREGAMLNYDNITDMVDGSINNLHVEKPKVLYNNVTKQYVMWMIVENGTRELGMAGVAVSDYPNGPFHFVRSLYPDGNQTRDQTLFQDDDGNVYLFRTYYDTVEYVLPQAVMQPTWESVKNADGSTNHALSFHRAEYEPGYDDYHDIYKQRWTTEDQPWKVVCVDKLTLQEREIPYGEVNYDGDVCQDPFEYKKVLGQGNPTYENSKNGIQSRFLDPNDPANNGWIPDSVPSVKGQTWKANYEDGTCGKRKINDDMQHYDPNLPFREKPNRGDCSNIVDNPIHPTLPDKRIGPQTKIESRRAKYIAISRLTDDYLDTSGNIKIIEGDLEGADLLSLVREYNKKSSDLFMWKTDTSGDIGSTFQPQIHDDHFSQVKETLLEHHQYETLYNDRAFYSPASVYDDTGPTDFKSIN